MKLNRKKQTNKKQQQQQQNPMFRQQNFDADFSSRSVKHMFLKTREFSI